MRASLKEMQLHVGDLQVGGSGLAEKGLLVRYLFMPGAHREAASVFRFLAEEISKNCYLNIMDQYRPCGEAKNLEGLDQMITGEHYRLAIEAALQVGLTRLDQKNFGEIFHRLLGR